MYLVCVAIDFIILHVASLADSKAIPVFVKQCTCLEDFNQILFLLRLLLILVFRGYNYCPDCILNSVSPRVCPRPLFFYHNVLVTNAIHEVPLDSLHHFAETFFPKVPLDSLQLFVVYYSIALQS